MKIIKEGKIEEQETKEKCHKCNTVFTYVPSDIKNDRDGNYVECPKFTTFIATN